MKPEMKTIELELTPLRHENLPDDEYGRGHEKGWGYLLSRFADAARGRARGA
jgi:hypothetical protein